MMTKTINLIAIIACAILLSPAAFAQQNQSQNKQDEPNWVETSGFKGTIFDIKNQDPVELVQILKPLGSGVKGAIMQPNRDYKTITVRDFPENIATIGEAIKRLDVVLPPKPQPPRPTFPDIQVFAYILTASNGEIAGAAPPQALTDVIKQLQATLNYKNYQLLTSVVQRTSFVDGRMDVVGTAELPDKSLSGRYQLQIARIYGQADSSRIELGTLAFQMDGFREEANQTVSIGSTKINTRLSIRDGEKVVVGTASLKDKAVILVLTTQILK